MADLAPTYKAEAAQLKLDELVAEIKTGGVVEGRPRNPNALRFFEALDNGTAGFLTIHYRNPRIDEGRLTEVILGDQGRKLTIKCLGDILPPEKVSDITAQQAIRFHHLLLEIYFGLIGRADSFSDAALRVTGRQDGEATDRTFTFIFDGTSGPHIECTSLGSELHIKVTRNLQYRLLGWDGDGVESAGPKDCKLLYPLYNVVWDNLTSASGRDVLRTCRDALEVACFFASREALVSGEAARLIRDEKAAKGALEIYGHLFAKEPITSEELLESEGKHKARLVMIEQVLAMIQAVAIYAPVSSDEFTIFAHKVNQGFPFASGVTVGGSTAAVSPLQPDSLGLVDLIDRPYRLAIDRKQAGNPLEKYVEWLKKVNWEVLEPELIGKGLSREAFECLAYYANGLLGKDHEGERLSFRIALGTDEGLRECFTPLFGETGLAEERTEKDFFRIDIPQNVSIDATNDTNGSSWSRVINKIDSLVALVQGNYSFVQDESIYICLAYVKSGLEVRYLAQLNSRLRRVRASSLFQSISRIDNVKSLSKTASPIILALLNRDHTGYIAFNSELLAQGIKGKPNQWSSYGEENWFLTKVTKEESRRPELVTAWQRWKSLGNPFYAHLCKVVELISDAPGKGATFVLGKWGEEKSLQGLCVEMTPVFEMVKGWTIEKIDKDTLYQAAIQDGAIVIATDKSRLYCRRQLSSFDSLGGNRPFDPYYWSPNDSKQELINLWDKVDSLYYWEDWGKWFRWGTRHKTAAGLAYLGRGEYSVLCISSDGDVHLFDGYRVYDLSKDREEGLHSATSSAAKTAQ